MKLLQNPAESIGENGSQVMRMKGNLLNDHRSERRHDGPDGHIAACPGRQHEQIGRQRRIPQRRDDDAHEGQPLDAKPRGRVPKVDHAGIEQAAQCPDGAEEQAGHRGHDEDSQRHDECGHQELRQHGFLIRYRHRFPEQDAAVLALGIQAIDAVEPQDHRERDPLRDPEHEQRDPEQAGAHVGVRLGGLRADRGVADDGAQHHECGDGKGRDPQRPMLPEFAPHECEQGAHVAASRGCILATNRSAIEGVRMSPSGASSEVGRPSKNIAIRPNTSRS